MNPDSTKLTIRLPRRHVEFAKAYAKSHGLTVTEVIDRYLRFMHSLEKRPLAPELEAIVGLVPPDVDAEGEYREHAGRRHSR